MLHFSFDRHQTVLYLHLRNHYTPEGYTWAELEKDLQQTRGMLLINDNDEDEDEDEEVWCDEPASAMAIRDAASETTLNVEMTAYARVTHPVQGPLRRESNEATAKDPLHMPTEVA